ncbi:hypothetical protein N9U97_00330 [Candidatus Pelagibacter sp.]|nr:hypothetical protein [Candidatus Pelagibacter sp.]MDA9754410.1 hypothetical protein [Candidatus Pelagibacter sp.]
MNIKSVYILDDRAILYINGEDAKEFLQNLISNDINTALESPLGQVSMIPLLAWIAKNAPAHLKATFFAVFASFTNLALSASALGTKYLNEVFTVTREVKDKVSGEIQTTADYSELGILLIVVTLLTLILPILFVIIINNSKYKTSE